MKLLHLVSGLTISLVLQVSCSAHKDVYTGYLFTYFAGNGPGHEQVHYALSRDGYSFRALNNNKPILDADKISSSGGVRDPHILRGNDGRFYMVLTDLKVPEMGWENTAMVLLKSTDLIEWSHAIIDVPLLFPDRFSNVNRVWAPQTIYDPEMDKYMIYWSMRHDEDADIIYYAYANDDFTGLDTEPKVLLHKTGACIDGDIIAKDGKYHLFFKNEDQNAKGIMLAISDRINEGYQVLPGYVDQTYEAVEGSGIFQLIDSDKYILMYDVYRKKQYQFCETTDLRHFQVIDEEISMDFKPRHGSVIAVTEHEVELLQSTYGALEGF